LILTKKIFFVKGSIRIETTETTEGSGRAGELESGGGEEVSLRK